MQFRRHVAITGGALRQWFVAQCYDSLAVGAMWWAGLTFLHVPWAPLWAVLAAFFQFIPQFGIVLTAIGPLLAALIGGGGMMALYVLILYGAIAVIDGLLLQPAIMRRTARVPIWASLTVPILFSLLFGFWGIVLAAPFLAVLFAYRQYMKQRAAAGPPQQTPPGQVISGGTLIEPEKQSNKVSE